MLTCISFFFIRLSHNSVIFIQKETIQIFFHVEFSPHNETGQGLPSPYIFMHQSLYINMHLKTIRKNTLLKLIQG